MIHAPSVGRATWATRTVKSHFLCWSALVICLLMVGCSTRTQTITYYEPYDSLGMEVTSGAGPANQAVFEIEKYNVRLMVVAQPSFNPPRIWVSVHLPKDVTMRIMGDHFTITPLDHSSTYSTNITYIRGAFLDNGEWVTREFQPGDELYGASVESVSHFWGNHEIISRQYTIVAPIGEKLPDSFEMIMPELEINGKAYKAPVLYFSKKTGNIKVKEGSNLRPW